MTEILINKTYKLGKQIGSGSFGTIYSGVNVKSSELVAIKLEKLDLPISYLPYEAKLNKNLQGHRKFRSSVTLLLVGFPTIYWEGIQDDYYCIVMALLGPNLTDLFKFCEKKFTLKTLVPFFAQMLDRV